MKFLIDTEKFLSKKKISFKHFMLMSVLSISLLWIVVSGMLYEDYFPIITAIVTLVLCFSFHKEIQKLHSQNQIISFQKNIAINGFDSCIFAFFVFNESGKCVFVNRVAQNLFLGFKIRSIEDFIICFGKYPKVVGAIHELQKIAKNSKQHHIDVPMNLHSNNTTLWRIAVSPLADKGGYSCWTIIDMTPSVSRIESLETNSNFLLDVINNSNVGYFCINSNNEITFCNNTFARWLGTNPNSVINSDFYAHIVKNESDDLINKSNKAKLVESMPIKLKLRSSISDEIEVIAKQIFQNNEEDIKAYVVSKEAQQSGDLIQALGKTKLYFEHIFEDAPVGILITDGAETISACNATFRKIVEVEKIEKGTFLNYISDEDRETVREKIYQLITALYQSMPPFEIHVNSKKSKTVMIYMSKIEENKRTKDNDGLVIYFIDITARKELQHQFVQSQKMQAVGQLAGGIAHDFNNLLTAMIGYCDLLLEKYIPSDQSFNDIMQIKQNANRASNLVRQLLAFSRQQTLQPKILSVTDMIGELSALLKRLLGAKVDLKVVHSRDVGFVKVDQIQFEQVIINLAVNARDAMREGGTLTIQTSLYKNTEPKFLRGDTMPPGEYILIEVADTGSGISESHLNRIFDPFFSTKEKGRGTGLGLSTVYGIVNQTGGFISVESEIGIGTKFSIYFPMVAKKEVAETKAKEAKNENKVVDVTGTGIILLVEDEDAVRMFSSRALRDKGYHVIEASNGEAALEFIRKDSEQIDLVITDVVMSKMDGPTLMENIKIYRPNMKVIFISGYTEDNFRESLANNDKVHFLSKPFNLKELAYKVKEVLG